MERCWFHVEIRCRLEDGRSFDRHIFPLTLTNGVTSSRRYCLFHSLSRSKIFDCLLVKLMTPQPWRLRFRAPTAPRGSLSPTCGGRDSRQHHLSHSRRIRKDSNLLSAPQGW